MVDIYADNTVTTRIPRQLRESDTHGKGAAEIGWGTPGDFDRCRAFMRRHDVPGHEIDGACANLHKLATGEWPGKNAHKGHLAMAAVVTLTAAMGPTFKGRRWSGPLAPIGVKTGDGRIFPENILKYQTFPMPFGFQEHSGRGHDGAVTVGVIEHAEERMHKGQRIIWGRGYLLNPDIIPDVKKAEHLIEHGIAGASVDLDSYTAALRPDMDGKPLQTLMDGRMRSATLVRIPAFADLRIEFDDDEEDSSDSVTASMETFTVNTSGWKGAPVAPREAQFDADDAVSRIEAWAENDPAKMAKLFLWTADSENSPLIGREGFRLPWGDIVDGKPYLIYHAVYAAAALLSGAHGGLPNISDQEKARLRGVVTEIYGHLAQELGDPNIRAPWDRRPEDERVVQASLISALGAVIEEFRDMPGGKRQPRVPGVPGARRSKHIDNPKGGEFIDVPGRGPHGQVKVGGKWVYPEKGAKDVEASAKRVAKRQAEAKGKTHVVSREERADTSKEREDDVKRAKELRSISVHKAPEKDEKPKKPEPKPEAKSEAKPEEKSVDKLQAEWDEIDADLTKARKNRKGDKPSDEEKALAEKLRAKDLELFRAERRGKESKKEAPSEHQRQEGESEEDFRKRIQSKGRKQLDEQSKETTDDQIRKDTEVRRKLNKERTGNESPLAEKETAQERGNRVAREIDEEEAKSKVAKAEVAKYRDEQQLKKLEAQRDALKGKLGMAEDKRRQSKGGRIASQQETKLRGQIRDKDREIARIKEGGGEKGLTSQEAAERSVKAEVAKDGGKTVVTKKAHKVSPAQQKALDALEKDPNAKIHPATRKVLEREGLIKAPKAAEAPVAEKINDRIEETVDEPMTDAEKKAIRREVLGKMMKDQGMLEGDRGKLWDKLSDEQKDNVIDQAVEALHEQDKTPGGKIEVVPKKTGKTIVAKKAEKLTGHQETTLKEIKARLDSGQTVTTKTGQKGLRSDTIARLLANGYLEGAPGADNPAAVRLSEKGRGALDLGVPGESAKDRLGRVQRGDLTPAEQKEHDRISAELDKTPGGKKETPEEREARVQKEMEEDKRRILERPGEKEKLVERVLNYQTQMPGGGRRRSVPTDQVRSMLSAAGLDNRDDQDSVLAKMDREGKIKLSDNGASIGHGDGKPRSDAGKTTVAKKEAPAAKTPEKHPATSAGIRQAYKDILKDKGEKHSDVSWVSVADIRDRIGGSREEQDKALREFEQDPDTDIVPQANQKALSQRSRDASVRIGGQDKTHLMVLPEEEVTRQSQGEAPKKASPATRTPKGIADKLKGLSDPDEAARELKGASKADLTEIAKEMDVPHTKSATGKQIHDSILQRVRSRRDTDALLRERPARPDRPTEAPSAPSKAEKVAEKLPESKAAPEKVTGGKIDTSKQSTKPRVKNNWGGYHDPKEAYAHPDGVIPRAAAALGPDGAIDVDGDRLDNVLDKIATDTVLGKTTGDQQIEQLRTLAARLPEGPAKRRIQAMVDELDAPKRERPASVKDAPEPLQKLMDYLLQFPLGRGGSDADRSSHPAYVDALDSLLKDWHDGKISPLRLSSELESRVYNRRHESYEGKVPIDRVIVDTIRELKEMVRQPGGRDKLTPPSRRQR